LSQPSFDELIGRLAGADIRFVVIGGSSGRRGA
jgi:hypothetical protein